MSDDDDKEEKNIIPKESTRDVLNNLSVREAKILKERFGIDLNTDHSLDAVRKQFEITQECIKKMEKKALKSKGSER